MIANLYKFSPKNIQYSLKDIYFLMVENVELQ